MRIGGGAAGKDSSIANAQLTAVDAASSISAGKGSKVVVWGDKLEMSGSVVAPLGMVEISGKQIAYDGKVGRQGRNHPL